MAYTKGLHFKNISATPGPFDIQSGQYGVTVKGTGFGTVTLQRLSSDASTYVTCLTAFSQNGYQTVNLPDGTYKLTIASASAVYADIEPVIQAP
jgi:hypothetical protein